MATLKTIAPATWNQEQAHTTIDNANLWTRFTEFANGQKQNQTLWFFMVLMVHGVLFLPLPAVLLYYYNAPIIVLAVTMACFFTNLIANMGGAGIRTTLLLFAASIFLHLLMAFVFII